MLFNYQWDQVINIVTEQLWHFSLPFQLYLYVPITPQDHTLDTFYFSERYRLLKKKAPLLFGTYFLNDRFLKLIKTMETIAKFDHLVSLSVEMCICCKSFIKHRLKYYILLWFSIFSVVGSVFNIFSRFWIMACNIQQHSF